MDLELERLPEAGNNKAASPGSRVVGLPLGQEKRDRVHRLDKGAVVQSRGSNQNLKLPILTSLKTKPVLQELFVQL